VPQKPQLVYGHGLCQRFVFKEVHQRRLLGLFQMEEFVAKAVWFGLVWSGLVRSLRPDKPGFSGLRFQVSDFVPSSVACYRSVVCHFEGSVHDRSLTFFIFSRNYSVLSGRDGVTGYPLEAV